jgi:hypothetical protein
VLASKLRRMKVAVQNASPLVTNDMVPTPGRSLPPVMRGQEVAALCLLASGALEGHLLRGGDRRPIPLPGGAVQQDSL